MSPIFAPLRNNFGGQVQGSQGAIVMAGISPLGSVSLPLSEGDRGTEETIAYIRQLVDQGVKDPEINRTAIAVLHQYRVRQFDFDGEKEAIYDWVRKNFRFVRDISGKETLRTAREILTVRAGDCDDINGILIPSLMGTIGHRVRLVTISAHPLAPKVFSHIYAEVKMSNGRWMPVDSARRDAAFGRGPAKYFRKRVWDLLSDDYVDVRGLGYYGRGSASALGDFDWSDFGDAAGKIGTSVANVISAVRRPPQYLYPQVPDFPPGRTIVGGGSVTFPGGIPPWVMYAGLAIGVFTLLRTR